MTDWTMPGGEAGPGKPWRFYRRAGGVSRWLLMRFGRLEVSGRENIPADGALLVANHIGWADPMWLMVAAWPRPLLQMAKRELFASRGAGAFFSGLGAFPVDRAAPGTSALRIPLQVIEQGGIVVVFPGGRRAAAVEGVKRGAATIAALSNCPIVVAHYAGPTSVKLKHLFRRPRVSVHFEPPFRIDAEAASGTERKALVKRISDVIEARLQSSPGETDEARRGS